MFVVGYALSRYRIDQTWQIMGVVMTLAGGALQLLELQWLHQNFGTDYLQDFVVSTALFGLGAAVLALFSLLHALPAYVNSWFELTLATL